MRTACLCTLLLAAASLHAAEEWPAVSQLPILPQSVVDACLSPSLHEEAANVTWQVLTPDAWGTAIELTEGAGQNASAQVGAEHPNGWVTTRFAVAQPRPTASNPTPAQTLTLTATPVGALPQVTLTFMLIKDAALPPCTVKAWNGRPALVADAGDWYLIAGSPKATWQREERKDGPRWTLTEKHTSRGAADALTASLTVGYGKLPPDPAAKQ